MKPALVLAALAASSPAPERPARDALMDEIERQLRLPFGARPLGEYGRYYFFEGKGRVKALFVHASDPAKVEAGAPGLSCSEGATRDGKYVIRAVRCPSDPAALRFLRAGHRQWVAGRSAAPTIYDGGCIVVHVSFDLETRKVDHVGCNGHG
ncbi:MAG TPA: hypothetical protein VF759_08640 [Allosphingosinicella sp.]|jgi:hypothetical protein